jgi:hypothetical protein
MKKIFDLSDGDSKNYPTLLLFKIIISICMISITLLIRTRQDLFVYENGNIGAFSPELIAILFIGMLLAWKKIYHVILVIFILSALFHLTLIDSTDHLTGKILLVSIEIFAILTLITTIKLQKKQKTVHYEV